MTAAPRDVLVIGGGQAGLAMGHELARRGARFEIVDAGAEVGGSWRSRWDSLRLFTAARFDGLPGLPFPAHPDSYPGKDAVADYLQHYAATFELPVRLNTPVAALTRFDGGYVAKAGDQELEARHVVVATGPFHLPFVPRLAEGLDPAVHQLHSTDYRRPGALPPGRTLVVGAANTGCQIAEELAATREVDLSVGARQPTVPQRPLGRDIWWWATLLRLDRVTADSRLGQRLAGRDQNIGVGPRQLARHGVRLRGRAVRAAGKTVTFADGAAADYDVVVWATGFTTDFRWIDEPSLTDEHGRVRHHRGVTAVSGLYLLGQTWQHTRGSALLGWVGNDAAYLADQITRTHR
ncbi:MAG TPA: NAD(P)/FAD-dependent oxidoreductase [Actinomycetes bacterium]|nr:NAD(P)/FAD-dependent oxidoreductase [Actinomycetes bacterium]